MEIDYIVSRVNGMFDSVFSDFIYIVVMSFNFVSVVFFILYNFVFLEFVFFYEVGLSLEFVVVFFIIQEVVMGIGYVDVFLDSFFFVLFLL